MSSFIVWKDGKPVSASNPKEAQRLQKRIKIIHEVLKDMGYKNTDDYPTILAHMAQTDMGKYIDFLKHVDKLAKERSC